MRYNVTKEPTQAEVIRAIDSPSVKIRMLKRHGITIRESGNNRTGEAIVEYDSSWWYLQWREGDQWDCRELGDRR